MRPGASVHSAHHPVTWQVSVADPANERPCRNATMPVVPEPAIRVEDGVAERGAGKDAALWRASARCGAGVDLGRDGPDRTAIAPRRIDTERLSLARAERPFRRRYCPLRSSRLSDP